MSIHGLAMVLMAAAGQSHSGGEGLRRFDALGGRLTLELPSRAKSQPREAGLMAAPESPSEETRFEWDDGLQRTVVMVTELFATEGTGLEAAVRDGAPPDADVTALPLALHAVRVTPRKPAMQGDAALIDSLFVAHTDHTVKRIDVYVNAPGLRGLAATQGRARALFASVSPGPHVLQAGGVRKNGDFVVTLPADAVLTEQEGPDFSVYRVHWLDPLGAPPRGLGIYVGFHPSTFHGQQTPPPRVTPEKGLLFGQAVQWDGWTDATTGKSMQEVTVPLNQEGPPLLAHVFVTWMPGADPEPARKTAVSLRLP